MEIDGVIRIIGFAVLSFRQESRKFDVSVMFVWKTLLVWSNIKSMSRILDRERKTFRIVGDSQTISAFKTTNWSCRSFYRKVKIIALINNHRSDYAKQPETSHLANIKQTFFAFLEWKKEKIYLNEFRFRFFFSNYFSLEFLSVRCCDCIKILRCIL